MSTFLFTILCTKPEHRDAWEASWRAAGFDAGDCRRVFLDNIGGNRHEPYSAFPRVAREAKERYLVFCHQDVRFDCGHGRERLEEALSELDAKRPGWAVAGVAGVDAGHRMVARINDGSTPWWSGELPREAVLLDEVFLVVNGAAHARWSEELAGFHCYGSDVCFHAIAGGASVHVIDFHLTHLGEGRIAPGLLEQHAALERRWSRNTRFCVGLSMMGLPLVLTHRSWLRWCFGHSALRARMRRPRWRRWLGGLLSAISSRTLRR